MGKNQIHLFTQNFCSSYIGLCCRYIKETGGNPNTVVIMVIILENRTPPTLSFFSPSIPCEQRFLSWVAVAWLVYLRTGVYKTNQLSDWWQATLTTSKSHTQEEPLRFQSDRKFQLDRNFVDPVESVDRSKDHFP